MSRDTTNFQIITIANPFDRTSRTRTVLPFVIGSTVAALLKQHAGDVRMTASINGLVIPEADHATTVVRPGDQLLFIPVIEGGGDGKQIWSALAMIAITVVGFGVGGALAGAMSMGKVAAGMFAAFTGATFGLAGGLMVSALTPEPQGRTGGRRDGGQSYGWNPQTTQQPGLPIPVWYGTNKLNGQVISAFTEPTSDNDKQTLTMIVALGRGPMGAITDIRINDQPIGQYTDVQYAIRYGTIDQPLVDGYDKTKTEYPPNQVVSSATPYVYTVSGSIYDEIEVDLTFPYGLYKLTSSGGLTVNTVKARIEYKRTADDESAWTPFAAGTPLTVTAIVLVNTKPKLTIGAGHGLLKGDLVVVAGIGGMTQLNGVWTVLNTGSNYVILDVDASGFDAYTSGGTVGNTAATITDKLRSGFRRTVGPIPRADPSAEYQIRITKLTPDRVKKNNDEDLRYGDDLYLGTVRTVVKAAFRYPRTAYVAVQALATESLSGGFTFCCISSSKYVRIWDGTAWRCQVSSNPAWVLYDVLTQPVLSGEPVVCEFQASLDGWTGTHCTLTAGAETLAIAGTAPDQYIVSPTIAIDGSSLTKLYIRIKRTAGAVWSGMIYYSTAGHGFSDSYRKAIVPATNLSSFEVIELDMSQLTAGGNDWITNTITSIRLDFGEASDNFELDYVSVGQYLPSCYDGIDPARIDLPKFLELAAHCDEVVTDGTRRITFNGGFDADSTLWETALKICEIARCVLVWNGTQLTLAIDKPADPVQLFTVGNTGQDSFQLTYLPQAERATEIEVQFRDASNDYERTPLTVLDATGEHSSSKVTLELFGITSDKEAWRAGMFRLNQNRLLSRTIEFTADIDAIACTIGDVINVQQDVPEWGEGGRIVAATSNTVTLDHAPEWDEISTYQVMIRLSTDTVVTKTVTDVDEAVLTISGTFASIPTSQSVYAYGKQNLLVRPYRIIGLSRDSDQRVRLTAIEYNAGIYAADGESTAIVRPASIPRTTPTVTGLAATETIAIDESGTSRRRVSITYRLPVTSAWDHVEIMVQVDGSTAWTKVGESRSSSFDWWAAEASTDYIIAAVSADKAGRRESIASAPSVELTTSESSSALASYLQARVTGLEIFGQGNNAVFTGRDARLVWNEVAAIDATVPAGEEALGAGGTSPNAWLRDYEVKILDPDGTVRRTAYTTAPAYTYTFERNSEDGAGTPARSVIVEVRARDQLFRSSVTPARLAISNPALAVPGGIAATGFIRSVRVQWQAVAGTDVAGYELWASTSASFTPSATNLIYQGPDTAFTFNLPAAATWYFRLAAYDLFGTDGLTLSSEFSAVAQEVPNTQLTAYDLKVPVLEGIAFTVSGTTVSWTAGTINYGAEAIAIASGNTTDAYIYYDMAASPHAGTLSHSATQPPVGKTATADVWLLCVLEASGKINVAVANQIAHAGLIQAGAITATKIAAETITAGEIHADAITTTKLNGLAVTTEKIADDAVTEWAFDSYIGATRALSEADWTTIGSLSMTKGTGEVWITFNVGLENAAGSAQDAYLRVHWSDDGADWSDLYASWENARQAVPASGTNSVSMTVIDGESGTGVRYYRVQALRGFGSSSVTAHQSSMCAIERKK